MTIEDLIAFVPPPSAPRDAKDTGKLEKKYW